MLSNAAFLLGFLLVSLTIGLVVPRVFPMVDHDVAYILGGFAMGVQIYIYLLLRQRRQLRAVQSRFERKLSEMGKDLAQVSSSVHFLAGEVKSLTASLGKSSGKNNELVSEVKMLQTLLSQVTEKRRALPAGETKPKSTPKSKAKQEAKVVPSKSRAASKEVVEDSVHVLEDDEVFEIIRNALKDNRIELFLQPIVILPSRKAMHYECFSRVRNQAGDIVFPRDYMHIARQSGLAGTLDNLLLFRAMKVIRQLGDRRPNVRFFLNISRSSLYDEEFFPQFIDFMMSNTDLSDRLVFELAQADINEMDQTIEHSLLALGQRGFRFSMDQVEDLNFDMAHLAERYFNYVKIDAPVLMSDTGHFHPEDLKEALSRFEMELIATKVEDEKTVVEILDHNVDYGQGFLFGEPKPPKGERDGNVDEM